MSDDRFTEFVPDYALGLLEGEELEEFERHLAAGCVPCERELASMDAVADALAYSAPAMAVPASLRARVLDAITHDAAPSPAPASMTVAAPSAPPAAAPSAAPPAAVAASSPVPVPARAPSVPGWMRLAPPLALVAVIAAGLTGTWAYRLDRQVTLLRSDLERVQAEKQALLRILDVVQTDRLRVVVLAGLESAPMAHGRVLWSPETRQAVLYAFGLPAPPAGRGYQMWAIEDDTPRSVGVFRVAADGRARHVLSEAPAVGGASAFAVTLEPAGGVPQPTGAMVLYGTARADE